jgi:hypothetical protein
MAERKRTDSERSLEEMVPRRGPYTSSECWIPHWVLDACLTVQQFRQVLSLACTTQAIPPPPEIESGDQGRT